MNERIKKHFSAALDKAVPYTWTSLDYVELEKVMQEFANSIIQDCTRVAINADLEDVEGGDGDVLRAAGQQIKLYFGVE